MIIEDLVILGRSSPDRMRDGRVSTCTAGYSEVHGFIRLYPTRLNSPLKVWNVVRVSVETNPRDFRAESWKIEGSKSDWEHLDEKIEVVGRVEGLDRMELVTSLISGCVSDLNDERRSLGIVEPSWKECYFDERETYDPTTQLTLWGKTAISNKNGYHFQPRIRYKCSKCKAIRYHDQQLLEWGVYEWFRKNPGKESQVWENLFWKEKQQRIFFLVGNLAFRPSSFVIISVLRLPQGSTVTG